MTKQRDSKIKRIFKLNQEYQKVVQISPHSHTRSKNSNFENALSRSNQAFPFPKVQPCTDNSQKVPENKKDIDYRILLSVINILYPIFLIYQISQVNVNISQLSIQPMVFTKLKSTLGTYPKQLLVLNIDPFNFFKCLSV